MTLGKISFTDLKDGNYEFREDVNAVVITSLMVDPKTPLDELQEEATNFFQGVGFVTDDSYVVQMLRITDNVLGDDGRHDYIVVFDKDPEFNYAARFRVPDIKWICDFVVNYRDDFNYYGNKE